jgi:hypothetical protein
MGGSGAGRFVKGDIVEVRAGNAPWGNLEALPDFIRVAVSDAEPAAILTLHDEYMQNFDWDVLSSDLPIDGHRLLLWTTNRSATGLGDVTLDQATAFLERWGGTNIVGQARGDAAGVRFDVTVLAAATSEGFWETEHVGQPGALPNAAAATAGAQLVNATMAGTRNVACPASGIVAGDLLIAQIHLRRPRAPPAGWPSRAIRTGMPETATWLCSGSGRWATRTEPRSRSSPPAGPPRICFKAGSIGFLRQTGSTC